MANNPIKYSDLIIDDGAIDKLIKKLSELERSYKELSEKIKTEAKSIKTETKNVNLADEGAIKRIQELEQKIESLNKKRKTEKQTLTEVEKLKKRLNRLSTEEAKKEQELKLAIQEKTKSLKDSVRQDKSATGSMKEVEASLRRNILRYRSLSKEQRESSKTGKQLLKTIQNQDEQVKKLNESIGRSQGSVGNYAKAFKGLGRSILQFSGVFALSDIIGKGFNLSMNLNKLTSDIQRLGEISDGSAKKVASNISAIASSFGKENQEILISANAVAKQFGISIEEATEKIKIGFVAGSDVNGDFLDILKEYPALLKEVGLDADQTFALINQQTKSGVYSDKGIDAIKEAGLRLREMPKATKEALDGIGLSSETIEKSLKDGSKSIFEITQQVSKQLGKLPAQSKEVGTAIADIFGSAGEDAGLKYLTTLGDINLSFNDMEKNLDEQASSQLRLVNATSELNNVVLSFLGDTNQGFNNLKSTTIEFATSGLKFIADNLATILRVLSSVVGSFVVYKATLLATKIATSIYSATQKIATVSTALFSGGLKKAKTSMMGLNTAVKSNPIGLLMSAIALVLPFLIDFADKTDDVTEAQKKANEVEKERQALLKVDLRKLYEARNKLSQNSLKSLKSSLEEQLNLEDEARSKQIADAEFNNTYYNDKIKLIKAEIKEEEKVAKITAKNTFYRAEIRKELAEDTQFFIKSKKAEIKSMQSKLISDEASSESTEKLKLQIKEVSLLIKNEVKIKNKRNKGTKEEIGLLGKLRNKVSQLRKEQELANNPIVIKQKQKEINQVQEQISALTNLDKKTKETTEIQKENAKSLEEIFEGFRQERVKGDQELQEIIDKIDNENILNAIESETKKQEKIEEIKRDALRKEVEETIANEKKKKEALKKINDNFDNEIKNIRKKQFKEQIKDLQDVTATAVFDSFKNNIDKQISELDKLESKQLSIIDKQEQRAKEGLSNNLAFEESALAELEQKKIKAQKKQIALQKVQALYNAYSSASASGDKNAIITVLRDFSILQGIESAISSFGKGTGEHGDINDSLKAGQNGSRGGNSITNGIIRGESHAKRGFGVPILAEGNEGIWKGSTMDKFGKNNFIQLTKSIDNGSIGSNFMQPQVNALQVVQSSSGVDGALLQEMKETRKAIQNKPEQVVDVQRMSENILDFVDTRKANNKKIINRYRVKKKRI